MIYREEIGNLSPVHSTGHGTNPLLCQSSLEKLKEPPPLKNLTL